MLDHYTQKMNLLGKKPVYKANTSYLMWPQPVYGEANNRADKHKGN